ncbi:MAG: hypothetical protein J6Q76_03040 [Clostridia bacterium]|nr:hypothetical protein [Clostridia bacterium]
MEYVFANDGVQFTVNFDKSEGVKYVLPLIGEISVETENRYSTEKIFYLCGGFIANEYTLKPDEKGYISVKLSKISANC